eukprot:11372590-Ditylum_brightwellii.AAC.1
MPSKIKNGCHVSGAHGDFIHVVDVPGDRSNKKRMRLKKRLFGQVSYSVGNNEYIPLSAPPICPHKQY